MFKIGDTVKIKSVDAIKKTLDTYGRYQGSELYFPHNMEEFCGKVLKVIHIYEGDTIALSDNKWSWHPNWLEPTELDNRRVEYV